ISRWIRKEKKNPNQKIDTNLKEEITCSLWKINKKLNIEIAEVGNYWSSELIQDLKGWRTILSQRDKVDKNRAKTLHFTVQKGKFEPWRNARQMEKHLQAQRSHTRKYLSFS
ncbi:13932_t:CDS:2, partial [Gigaspora rosea]